MNARNSASVFHSNSVVCSHHVYKRIWSPFIGETLSLEWKPGNTCDQCTVCVKRGPDIFGHVPREISCIMSQFLAYNGNASCYRKSKFGVGLEVPCVCKFGGGGGGGGGGGETQIKKKLFSASNSCSYSFSSFFYSSFFVLSVSTSVVHISSLFDITLLNTNK